LISPTRSNQDGPKVTDSQNRNPTNRLQSTPIMMQLNLLSKSLKCKYFQKIISAKPIKKNKMLIQKEEIEKMNE